MRIFVWSIGGLAVLLVLGGIALQMAIARNGPAVLSAVDRLTGGSRNAALLATSSTGEHPAQKLIVWGPADRSADDAPLPVLVFAHGGSWRSGDPADYGFFARAFVPKGFVVVLVGYRLVKGDAADGVYPAMLVDTASAIRWTRDEIAKYGGDRDRIVLVGHSAGAYNVVMTALDPQWLAREGADADALAGVIGLSGPYDFYPFDSESTINAFGHADDPEATQPINRVRDDAPSMLFIHGDKDTLVRSRNSRELAKRIEVAGGAAELKIYPEMEHNDPLISLAAPWRSRRDVAETMVRFARQVTAQE